MKLLIILFLFFNGIICEIQLIPTTFSPNEGITYSSNDRTFNLQMDLCDEAIYENCLFTAEMNLPFSEWSVDNGIYTSYAIIGGNNCNTLLCSNDINSQTPEICQFYLPSNLGSTVLYMVSESGITASLISTFNLRINCSLKSDSNPQNYSGVCPRVFSTSRRSIELNVPGSVLTSQTQPNYYSFVICPSSSSVASFDFALEATDQYSQFATYFCPTTKCTPSLSPLGWYDDSASAINHVTVSELKTQFIGFSVYGWGKYNAYNHYVFDVRIQNQD